MSGNRRERVVTARDLATPDRTWFRVDNARGAETHIYIYNEIGYWGITADDFSEALDEVTTGRVTLHINSPGGSVFEGVTIYNTLRDHPARVDVMIDGVAASAASFIAQAGDTITMNRGAEMMVHNAHGQVQGDSAALRDMANMLDRQNRKIAGIYQDRAGGPVEHWLGVMDAETWYDPTEAVQAGLADRAVVDSDQSKDDKRNGYDLSVYNFAGRSASPAPVLWNGDPEPPTTPTPAVPEPEPVPEPAATPQDRLARLRAAINNKETSNA